MHKLILTWKDKDNKLHSKEYTDQTELAKAKTWLAKHGATDIDVAVKLVK